MDNRSVAQSANHCASSPYRHSDQDHDIAKWIGPKDELSYDDTYTSSGPFFMTESDPSFLTSEMQSAPGVSWDATMPMDNLILDQCQPFLNNNPYQHSGSSGTPNSGSQTIFDQLAIDPSLTLSTTAYSGAYALSVGATVGLNDNSFSNDFAPGSFSYDSSSSIYISPPLSPELQGQNWHGMPIDSGMDGQNAGVEAQFGQPQSNGSPKQPSPPSPPMSDGDPRATLTSVHHPTVGRQITLESYAQQQPKTTRSRSTQGRYRGSGPATPSSSGRLPISIGQSPTHTRRPAQRILKPASEKPRGHDQGSQLPASSGHSKSKEKPEAAQPRNHHLYKALPGKDGLFRCPFARETQCAHVPTKQKCGYDKYLDSHLKPYQCKNHECRDLRFSSNACLFRHEREAHGMHFYGKNPHRCHFAGCDRAIEGFPRRWNLHDHMRRVHKYDAMQALDSKDDESDYEVPSKRKGSDAPTSCRMKRTSSSQAKARAASASYSRDNHEAVDLGYPARRMSYPQSFDLGQQPLNFAHVFSSGTQQVPYDGAVSQMSYGFSYP